MPDDTKPRCDPCKRPIDPAHAYRVEIQKSSEPGVPAYAWNMCAVCTNYVLDAIENLREGRG